MEFEQDDNYYCSPAYITLTKNSSDTNIVNSNDTTFYYTLKSTRHDTVKIYGENQGLMIQFVGFNNNIYLIICNQFFLTNNTLIIM